MFVKQAKSNTMKTDLVEIFQTIRASMQPYATQGFTTRKNTDELYELWSDKDIEIAGRKRSEVFFASVSIMNGYVGFYFMPIYVQPELKALIAPALLKILKGKSCFHVKKLDDELLEHIVNALAAGFTLYKQNGWV